MHCGFCGRENGPDARFCQGCGAQLVPGIPLPPSPPPGPGDPISDAGRRMGDAFSRMGKTWGEEARKGGFRLQNWWDDTLGILSPIVSGLIGVFVLLLAIIVFGTVSDISEHPGFWDDIATFLVHNLVLIIALIFLSSFSNYLRRRFRKTWRWAIPVPIAIGSIGSLWVFAELLKITALDLGHPTLHGLADLIDLFLPVIFVVVLVLGYLMVFWITIGERGDEPRRYNEFGRIR